MKRKQHRIRKARYVIKNGDALFINSKGRVVNLIHFSHAQDAREHMRKHYPEARESSPRVVRDAEGNRPFG